MEKLLELLNNWERERVNHNTKEFIPYGESSFSDLSVERITSKKYGFIKRLVENDKIDLNKVKGKSDRIYYKEYGSGGFTCSNEELVIMLLSISSSPIDDLISYLK